jgi:AbrB family looped-hinge helix DNA binding protein
MSIVKVQHKGQMTIPRSVRFAVGLADGDLVEVKATGRKIIITPQPVIGRSQFANTDDEYTPAQRRVIDRGIAQSEKEYKRGRSFGPFETHEAFINSLHTEVAKLRGKKTKRAAK